MLGGWRGKVMGMKRTAQMLVLGAAFCLALVAEAAPRPAVAVVNPIAVIEPTGDGQTFFVEVDESKDRLAPGETAVMDDSPAMHWSPGRGFHADKGCCKTARAGGSRARVSIQRFAGIDPAANRPMYVGRGRN
jgi:hypothetical protein